MKIAYCMSGHLRTFAKAITSQRRNLFAHYPGDIYVHTYPVYNARGPMWHSDRRGHDKHVTDEDFALLRGMLEPVALEVDTLHCGADSLQPALTKMGFRVSRARAHEIRISSGKRYDLVVDIRPDLVLGETFALPDITPNTFYGSYNLTSIEQGIDGEVFSYGAPDVMDKIMLPAIPKWVEKDIPAMRFCGERLVTEIRLHHKIAYKAHRVKHGLMRSSGDVEWVRQ